MSDKKEPEDLEELKTRIEALEHKFAMVDGGMVVVRILVYGVAALWAVVVWFKDHIKV